MDSPSLKRFLSDYGKIRTRAVFLECLVRYRCWLKEAKGTDLSFDQLVGDNLAKVFGSGPADVLVELTYLDGARSRNRNNLQQEA